MTEALRTIAWRLALCAGATWALWRLGFGTGTLFMVGMVGIALARPLLDLAGALRHEMRRAVWHDDEGRHYAFHGVPVSMREDEAHRRWVRLADVRRIVGFTAGDAALKVTYPSGWRVYGRARELHLDDEALIAHLAKERSEIAAKFRHWAEREIHFPAARLREHERGRDQPRMRSTNDVVE